MCEQRHQYGRSASLRRECPIVRRTNDGTISLVEVPETATAFGDYGNVGIPVCNVF